MATTAIASKTSRASSHPPPEQDVADGEECEGEREKERRAPEIWRPPKDCGQRLRNLGVDIGRADRATVAAKAVTSEARTRNVASIGRRLRRIGSAGVSSERLHDLLAVTGCEECCLGDCVIGDSFPDARPRRVYRDGATLRRKTG